MSDGPETPSDADGTGPDASPGSGSGDPGADSGRPGIDPDAPLSALVERLHAELAATEELPVERTAARWVGEAQAVAADAASVSDEAVVRERATRVRELLAEVESTGHERADAHLDRARALAAAASGGGRDDVADR